MTIRKIEAGRVITKDVDSFVGTHGTIWYDELTGGMRLYDGSPGGIAISGGSEYVLHAATTTTLGGVKLGVELSISNTGTLNVDLSAVTQAIIPNIDAEYSLGTPELRWKDIHVSTGSVYIGDLKLSNDIGTLLLGTSAQLDLDPYTIIRGERDVNNYATISVRNVNTGNNASADIILYQGGNDADHYVDLGIASDNYAYSEYEIIKPGDTYLFGRGGDVKIGTASSGTDVVFFTGGTNTSTNEIARFKDGQGLLLQGNIMFADGSTMSSAITGLETNSTDTVTISAGFNFVPATNNLQDIGSDSLRFRDLYLSGNSIYLAGQKVSSSAAGIELPIGSTIGGINPGTIVIKGKRDSVELLPITDVIGDGYIVNLNLWVWSGTEYTDVGQIVGPTGETGLTGLRGLTGLTGPRGASGTGTSGTISLEISEINSANSLTNTVTNVTAIRFDKDTGFNVTDLGAGEVKVSLGSAFKTWKVEGQEDVVAVGEDTIELKAGSGVTLTTNPTAPTKFITIASNMVWSSNNW